MFKSLFKKKTKEEFPSMIVARMNDRAQPIERGDLYEDPLHEMMQVAKIGEVTGGGTQLSDTGEIAFCDVEIRTRDAQKPTVQAIIEMLEKLGAPRGSNLIVEGNDKIPFGKLEGVAVYLNGTDLPDHVYRECDSNHVFSEFNRLLSGVGKIHSTWQGPTETAFYLYGNSVGEMKERLSAFIASYPLCAKARSVPIA